MTQERLENLLRIGKLKAEPPDQQEFDGLLRSAQARLKDAALPGLSADGRFDLAYGAAHALALAALRWHGYRSDNRYLVFQCLEQTAGLSTVQWRVLDLCHQRRNVAEYEGHLEIDAQLLDELVRTATVLLDRVCALGPVLAR